MWWSALTAMLVQPRSDPWHLAELSIDNLMETILIKLMWEYLLRCGQCSSLGRHPRLYKSGEIKLGTHTYFSPLLPVLRM